MKRSVFALLLSAAGAMAFSSAALSETPVNIGIVQATSGGSAALYGLMQKNGAELAIDEINTSGKLGDYKLVGIHQDDAGDRGQSVNIFQRLINQEKVAVILGPTLATSAFAADPLAQKAGVPVIASSNTAPGITDMGDYIFRTSPPESMVFPGVLAYVKKKYSPKTAAQIYGIDDTLMKSAYAVHKKALESEDIKIVATETFQKGDVDYSAQLTKIKAANPDILVIGGLAEETANIVRQARQLGIPPSTVILGANAAISNKLAELAGAAADGFTVGSGWFIQYDSPKNKAFVEAYRKRYSSEPDNFAAQAYTSVYVVADAVKRAGGVSDLKKLRDAIAATKDLEANNGSFSFDAHREPAVTPKVLVMKGGKFILAAD
ncbi:ABC transporter substrate-binding protein [Bradyrhizobium sp. Leo121]|uniref:ABC transporter substrate-binding protein n=1 Tax=Bradyrhizobium sp. Leo121 TaxID=1571195 RepID=UPI0010288870|nr:ABC transporter substrate-binding protein [Bradyrhizobium sp. Leo121]RZN31958.1 ABC transporter substrate-binding protein [Bradyrhizobium sp. Leo121]